MYSVRNPRWERCGHNIEYFENHLAKQLEGGLFNTLSFEFKFENDDDDVYFAHNFPYSYSDLTHFIQTTERESNMKDKFRVNTMTKSLADNDVPCLIITDYTKDH